MMHESVLLLFALPLKPSKHLPKRYNRRVSKQVRELVGRKYKRHSRFRKEGFRRTLRRTQQAAHQWKRSALQWSVISGISLVAVGIFLLLFSPLLSVREITIRRLSPRLDIEQAQRVLAPVFGRHLFFLEKSDVRQLLEEGMNDLKTIEIAKDYPSELIVTVALDPVVAHLEIVNPDAEENSTSGTGSSADFLTEKGVYIQAVNPEEEEGLQTIRLVDWGVRPAPGTQLISIAVLDRLHKTTQALGAQFGLPTERQTIYLRAQEYHIQVNGKELWFDMKSSLGQHLQRYRIFLQSVPMTDVEQYIDLRLTDRIVYM